MSLHLYGYWRSSASWRVRIALALKGLHFESRPVHLARDGGEQHGAHYRAANPEGLVPMLDDGGFRLSQSLAICEYLDAAYPEPALLPSEPRAAATVRSFCQVIACDTHPLNNLRVLQYLENKLDVSDEDRNAWYRHWIGLSFAALEARLAHQTTRFAFGDAPGLAECFLIPQMYNARRFDTPLAAYPRLVAIESASLALPAFILSHPDQQPDKPA